MAGADECGADDEAAWRGVQAAVNALRAYRAEQRSPPAKVLQAAFVADDDDAARGARCRVLRRRLPRPGAHRGRPPARPAHGESSGETIVLVPGGRFEVPRRRRPGRGARAPAGAARQGSRPRWRAARPSSANESFVERAPQAVVDKERAKLAGYRADRDELAARLAQLA